MQNELIRTDTLVDSFLIKEGVQPISTAPHSLFTDHLLNSSNLELPNTLEQNYWLVTVLILLMSALFVWLFVFKPRDVQQVLNNFFTLGGSSSISRMEINVDNTTSGLLYVFFILNFSLFIGKGLHTFAINIDVVPVPVEMVIGIITLVTYLTKIAVVKISGYLFQVQFATDFYAKTIFNFQLILGLVLLPIVIIAYFAVDFSPKVVVYLGAIFLTLMFLFRILRGLSIGANTPNVSLYYLFIYLCALEIIPILIIVKLIALSLSS